ncbi:flagellar biosynthetic protein FliR [Roseomonas sp. CCTCC AB2023176]|uniref:flagellar biosynthetic protein FliR n=1 Tax=Roseomonas sp. CCTCC AB2023176 TaxID=3342640 RepID=UPI0035D89830
MTEAELLAGLPDAAFRAALLLARIGAAAMLVPGLGEAEIPAPLRLGVALAIVAAVFPVLAPALPNVPDAAADAVRLVALEVLTGLWLASLARLLATALALALQTAGGLLGLANVLVPDPALGSGATALGRLGSLAAALLVLSSGLYALPLRALVESYALMPPGAPWPAGAAAEEIAAAGGACLSLALRLAGPFVVAAVLLNLALALVSRVAPQVPVFVLGAPAQVLVAFALLALLAPLLLPLFAGDLRAGWSALPGLR